MTQSTEQNMARFLNLMNAETLTKADFEKAFNEVLDIVEQVLKKQQEFERFLGANNAEFKQTIKEEVQKAINDLKTKTNELFVGERISEMSAEQKKLFNSLKKEATTTLDKRMASMMKEIEKRAVKGDKGDPGVTKPTSSEEVVAIVAPVLDKFKEDMEEKSRKDMSRGNALGSLVNALQVHIVSDQFDGVTRQFNMPTATRVVKFEMSQAPFNLYEDTPTEVHGFTVGPNFIRLHDTVPAPQPGQSGAIYYQK